MAYWCAAQLQFNREALALHMLQEIEGFTIYAPRLRQRRRRRGRWIETLPLLFPAYAFIWIELQWWRARWAPGVIRLIMDGVEPARVSDLIIAEIQAREVRGAVELPKAPGMRLGDRVRVIHGPFANLFGLYAGMRPRARIELLLTLLGGQQRVTLPRASVEAVPDV